MAHVIHEFRREAARAQLAEMGVESSLRRAVTIGTMSDALAKDDPYGAVQAAMLHVDLRAAHKLIVTLLVGGDEDAMLAREKAARDAVRAAEEDRARHRKEAWAAQENAQKVIEIAREQMAHADRKRDEAEERADRTIASISAQLEAEFEKRVENEVAHRLHGPVQAQDGRVRRPIVL